MQETGSSGIRIRVYLSVLLLSFFAGYIISLPGCKDSVTNPPEEKPPGYQPDIPWPSMDKNPWPIYNGDAQHTGRSRYAGPTQGIIEWQIEIPALRINDDTFLSPVCDDSTIYVVSYSDTGQDLTHLRAISFNGEEKWKLADLKSVGWEGKVTSQPILSSDGTIYLADWMHTVFAVNRDGTIKWKLDVSPAHVNSQMNLDKEGNLYFLASNGILHKVSPQGRILWRLILSEFGSSSCSVVFSPDGKTMYLTEDKLYAVTTEGELKWSYQHPTAPNTYSTIPLVDASGNIHIFNGYQRIKPNGITFPYYPYPDSVKKFFHVNSNIDPTIDKNGNVYIGAYGLASFDHKGEFRWAKNIRLQGYVSLVCDKDNNIYFLTYDRKLTCIDINGVEKWQLQLDGHYYYTPIIANGRMYFGAVKGTKRYFCSIK